MVDDGGADRTEISQLLGRFLAAVSFPNGARPSYDDLHDLFVDGAKLVIVKRELCLDAQPNIFEIGGRGLGFGSTR